MSTSKRKRAIIPLLGIASLFGHTFFPNNLKSRETLQYSTYCYSQDHDTNYLRNLLRW
jgi:hypothetical protein